MVNALPKLKPSGGGWKEIVEVTNKIVDEISAINKTISMLVLKQNKKKEDK